MHGVLCQVTELFAKNNPSCTIHEKWHKNKGFAHAMVISPLNYSILSKGGVTVAKGGMEGGNLSSLLIGKYNKHLV